MDQLKAFIRTIPDFPKRGIEFRDLTTLFLHPEGFRQAVAALANGRGTDSVDVVVGVEARGFIVGAPLAVHLNKGFVPIRKPGKLPGAVIGVDYQLEYGSDRLEIHEEALAKGARVLMVDDLLATGGTMEAACNLVEQVGGEIVACTFIVELVDLKGRERLSRYAVDSLVQYEGE